jgi:arylsulfatase
LVGEIATGYPGYDSIIPIDKGTVGTILKANGYAPRGSARTTTRRLTSRARPGRSNNGPTAWASNISMASSAATPASGNPTCTAIRRRSIRSRAIPDWNLTTAMADEAIQHMKQLKEIAPEKPFFVYYVPGGTHAPHHPTPEWIKKIGDMHCSTGLEQAARDHLRQPEAAWASCLTTPS